MLRSRWSPTAIGVVITVLLATGGMAFAATGWQATATVGAGSSGGQICLEFTYLVINYTFSAGETPSYVGFLTPPGPPSLPSNNPIVAVGPVGPTDLIAFDFAVTDCGNLAVVAPTLGITTSANTPPACDNMLKVGGQYWWVSPQPDSLAVGVTLHGTFWLTVNPSSTCTATGGTDSFTFVVSGTAA